MFEISDKAKRGIEALALKEINDHRIAWGRKPFESLTPQQMHQHMHLIQEHAPHGNDPWEHEDQN